MGEMFGNHPKCLANTNVVADRIEDFELGTHKIPVSVPVPALFGSIAEGLRHLVMRGAETRWGRPIPADVGARLERELAVLLKARGGEIGLLLTHDLVEAARKLGVWTGPGRGPAVGSAVCYALGISDVDPMRHGLLFERFVRDENAAFPEIAIDFETGAKDALAQCLTEKFGDERLVSVAAYTRFREDTAIRDVSRVLEYPQENAQELAAKTPERPASWRGVWRVEDTPALAELYRRNGTLESRILHISEKLYGCIRSVGTHPSRIAFADEQQAAFRIPLYGADARLLPLSQFDSRSLDALGVFRFNILGCRALTVMKNCVGLVEASGRQIDLQKDAAFDDAETLALFGNDNTDGIPEFDSEAIRRTLRRLVPVDFGSLVTVYAMSVVDSTELLDKYIRRRSRGGVVLRHPLLEPVLGETFGVLVYQEQLMALAQSLAGFSPAESDLLRRAVTKKMDDRTNRFKTGFVAGCLRNPAFRAGGFVDEARARTCAEAIFEDCRKDGLWCYLKCHAVAVSVLAFRLAYLKARYPAEFSHARIMPDGPEKYNRQTVFKIRFQRSKYCIM